MTAQNLALFMLSVTPPLFFLETSSVSSMPYSAKREAPAYPNRMCLSPAGRPEVRLRHEIEAEMHHRQHPTSSRWSVLSTLVHSTPTFDDVICSQASRVLLRPRSSHGNGGSL